MVNKKKIERVLQPGEQALRDMFLGKRTDEQRDHAVLQRQEGTDRARALLTDVANHTPQVLHETKGENRRERRHIAVPPTGKVVNIPKRFQARTFNEPYVKPVAE